MQLTVILEFKAVCFHFPPEGGGQFATKRRGEKSKRGQSTIWTSGATVSGASELGF